MTVVKVPGVSFPALGAAWELPSIPRLPLSSGPVELHTGSHQLVPVTTRQGVPGTLGQVVHLPQLVQMPLGAALCPPAYGWVQQVVMGTLLPHQPRAVVQEEALYPIGSSVFHIHQQPALALLDDTTTMEPEGKFWQVAKPMHWADRLRKTSISWGSIFRSGDHGSARGGTSCHHRGHS